MLLAAAAAVAQPNDDASARIKNILSRVGSGSAAPDGAAAEDLRARLDRLRAGRLFDGVDAAARRPRRQRHRTTSRCAWSRETTAPREPVRRSPQKS